jgi:beta-glucanase (GH16 family)
MKKLSSFLIATLIVIFLSVWSPPFYQQSSKPLQVFADEFSGNTLNTNTWYSCSGGCVPWGNELETYWSSNVSVHDGTLDLVANKSGSRYTSGKIQSYKSFLYGHFESRMLIPYGQGYWPAFWLLHDAVEANSNEIDIMESINNDHTNYMSDHYNINGQYQIVTSSTPITQGWHVLALDWQKDKLVWYIDGVTKFSITDASKIPNTSMFIILNLAIGGDWPGNPSSSTVFPAHYLVDYMRVSQ